MDKDAEYSVLKEQWGSLATFGLSCSQVRIINQTAHKKMAKPPSSCLAPALAPLKTWDLTETNRQVQTREQTDQTKAQWLRHWAFVAHPPPKNGYRHSFSFCFSFLVKGHQCLTGHTTAYSRFQVFLLVS
jgi:hypothetical protein